MPLTVPLWRRQWRVRPGWLLLTVLASLLFVRLGFWQWGRGEQRAQLWQNFALQQTLAPRKFSGPLPPDLPRYTRVQLSGRYDGGHQILLDNISHDGKPGYEVLTPLALTGGGHVLIDRGWLPFAGYRDRLPDVTLAGDALTQVTGRLDHLPQAGMASGSLKPAATGSWPRLTSFPTLAELAVLLERPLAAQVVLLDAESGQGYLRQWQPPGVSPDRNYSYAVQWWAFAVLAWALLLGLNLEKRP
jgi:surfeit locus 1 family protein